LLCHMTFVEARTKFHALSFPTQRWSTDGDIPALLGRAILTTPTPTGLGVTDFIGCIGSDTYCTP